MAAYALRTNTEERTAALTSFSPLMRSLLAARDITLPEDAERFLELDWERDTHDPFLMLGMEAACGRIVEAMANGERIAIWSDYDMDGIPGAVVLWDTFAKVGYTNVVHHTPHRNKDGFGLNVMGLDKLHADGVSLIMTVDCGIGDVEQVAHAQALGIDVIVTDHHLPHDTLPPAHTILNPKQGECQYPENMLCGAAVAWKLAHALVLYLGRETVTTPAGCSVPDAAWTKWLLDMVGMATIADMVPLVGENRVLAQFGLVVLRKSRRPGLQALLKKARADQRYLTEEDIGFTIAPRINAASRMGHASDAFKLLASVDAVEAGALAELLDQTNKERKVVVAGMAKEIKQRMRKLGEPKEVIVMGNPAWKPSMLGLVAGSLVSEFARPVFLWGREEGATIKGSCRSDGSVNVVEVMAGAKDTFIEYGGHAFSGGFSLEQDHVHALEEALLSAHRSAAKADVERTLYVDATLTVEDITWPLYHEVSKLAPFGEANKKPLFLIREACVRDVRTFGKASEHVGVRLVGTSGKELDSIAFFTTARDLSAVLEPGMPVSLIGYLEASYFKRSPELRMRIVDVQAAGPREERELVGKNDPGAADVRA